MNYIKLEHSHPMKKQTESQTRSRPNSPRCGANKYQEEQQADIIKEKMAGQQRELDRVTQGREWAQIPYIAPWPKGRMPAQRRSMTPLRTNGGQFNGSTTRNDGYAKKKGTFHEETRMPAGEKLPKGKLGNMRPENRM